MKGTPLRWQRHARVPAACAALLAAACGPLDGQRPEDLRVVRMLLIPPSSQQDALGGTRPVQLAALRVEAGQALELRLSAAVDPRTTTRLSVGLRKDASYNLFLQTPRGGTGSIGQLVGRILWNDGTGSLTTRLRRGHQDLSLGDLVIATGSPSTLSDNTLQVADEQSPAAFQDSDSDGQTDAVDGDDDQDTLEDTQDPDADGDGLADLDQTLASLVDNNGRQDGDGVPDDLE